MKSLSRLSPDRIVYISCNPVTQARDYKVIEKYYRIERIQPVDNFAFTAEIENIVLLKKRNRK